MRKATVHTIRLYPLAIPLRHAVAHAGAEREVAEPIVVSIEFNEDVTGYGETLPRAYVTGETHESVMSALQGPLQKLLLTFNPTSFGAALEQIDALPFHGPDRTPLPAARAAVELALLDASMRFFDRTFDDVVSWMGLPGFGTPGSLPGLRFSGVLACRDPLRLRRQLRLMYWGGLRHFKLKVGMADDDERFDAVTRYLGGPLAAGRVTVRLDANGAWSKDEAIERLGDWRDHPISGIEQPLPRGQEEDLPILKDLFDFPLIHDESVITRDDAILLNDLGVADVFNIRVSKCGGILASLHLAQLVRRMGGDVQIGCMVGETSLLTAAALRLLSVCPGVRWAEGAFGRLLLKRDVVGKPLQFGYGGRAPQLRGPGLGVEPDPAALRGLCVGEPIVTHL
ncbi:MAG: hypothetical protein C4547_15935 [Phycisphaerales bacterium]|nr:MAG: hypothetical protein C4547_15935 [Phycisphaerales bacterium]